MITIKTVVNHIPMNICHQCKINCWYTSKESMHVYYCVATCWQKGVQSVITWAVIIDCYVLKPCTVITQVYQYVIFVLVVGLMIIYSAS